MNFARYVLINWTWRTYVLLQVDANPDLNPRKKTNYFCINELRIRDLILFIVNC